MGRSRTQVVRQRQDDAHTFAKDIVDSQEYRTSVRARAINGTLPPQIEQLLLHYRFGKPTDHVSAEVTVHSNLPDLSELSEAELRRKAAMLVQALDETIAQDRKNQVVEAEKVEVSTSSVPPKTELPDAS